MSSIFAGFDTVAQPFEARLGNSTYVGIQLQPQAPDSMIGADMKDCVNRWLALSELLGSWQSRIWEALERCSRSLQSTGLTPRELIRIYRFVRARKLYRPDISFAELALAGGFADQAHISREFRRIVGRPPSQYFH